MPNHADCCYPTDVGEHELYRSLPDDARYPFSYGSISRERMAMDGRPRS